MTRVFLCLCLWVPPAFGETAAGAMTAEAFEVFSTGHTVTYGNGSLVYGQEEYRANREVIWRSPGGECERGHWYPAENGQICFDYDSGNKAVCWVFQAEGDQVRAQSVAAPDAPPLIAIGISDQPLDCPGPDVGV